MRLWLSVAILLIFVAVVTEASAAKSNRGTDTTKDNQKAINSKEVHYSKNKSEFKKKVKGKNQEVLKEKKQRHSVEGKEKIDSNQFLRKNLDESNGKISHEEQKRQKFNKRTKMIEKGENFKQHRNVVKVTKDTAKKHKRSIELEQPEGSLIHNNAGSVSKNKDSRMDSVAKNAVKDKLEKKLKNYVEQGLDYESDGDATSNTKEVSDNQPSEEAVSLLDSNVRSSSKNKMTEKQQGDSKNKKYQRHKDKRGDLREDNTNTQKKESTEEDNHTPEKSEELGETNQYLDELSENNDYTNKNGLHKSSTASKCGCQVNVCDSPISDEAKDVTEQSKKSKSGSCNLTTQCSLKNQNEAQIKKSKYFADDHERSCVVKIEQQEVEDKESPNVHLEPSEKNKIRDSNVEVKNCAREKSVQEDVMREICSTK